MIDKNQNATNEAFNQAVRDTEPLVNNIVNSGIENATRKMMHLYRWKAWFTPPNSPLPAEGTMVADRVCAFDWNNALEKINARLVASCLANKLPANAYQIGKVEVIELDMPITDLPFEQPSA